MTHDNETSRASAPRSRRLVGGIAIAAAVLGSTGVAMAHDVSSGRTDAPATARSDASVRSNERHGLVRAWGTVTSVDGSSFTLDTKHGAVAVSASDDTIWMTKDAAHSERTAASAGDLAVGQRVRVFGIGSGRALAASVVRISPAAPAEATTTTAVKVAPEPVAVEPAQASDDKDGDKDGVDSSDDDRCDHRDGDRDGEWDGRGDGDDEWDGDDDHEWDDDGWDDRDRDGGDRS